MEKLTSGLRCSNDYYVILGVGRSSTVEQINAEYKSRVLSCHPDKNPDKVEASAIFKELQEAKACLTDPKRRKDYDTWLDCGINLTFTDWSALKERNQMSMHWCNSKKTDPMIEHTSPDEDSFDQTFIWERGRPSDLLRKFRNYEI